MWNAQVNFWWEIKLRKWVFHIRFLQNVWIVAHCLLIINREPKTKLIVLIAKWFANKSLLEPMLIDVEKLRWVKLHGAEFFSQYSRCRDCKRHIIDMSRSKKRSRCEPCAEQRMILVKRLSSKRIQKEKLAEKRKKVNA